MLTKKENSLNSNDLYIILIIIIYYMFKISNVYRTVRVLNTFFQTFNTYFTAEVNISKYPNNPAIYTYFNVEVNTRPIRTIFVIDWLKQFNITVLVVECSW